MHLSRLLKKDPVQVKSAKSRLRAPPCLRPARRDCAQAGETLRDDECLTATFA